MFSDPVSILKFLVEVGVFIGVFYYLLKFFQGTRGAQALTGLLMAFGALWILSMAFGLEILNWALRQLSVWMVLGFVIIFAPEIRRALAGLGWRGWGGADPEADARLIDKVVTAACNLSERKIGALVAIERDIGLGAFRESGAQLDSAVDPQLLTSIFYPQAPLHDGGVIIAGNRIAAASCVFPLTTQDVGRGLGTRHRAAVGLSDETDAIVVIVSEETGTISLAYKGNLTRGLDEDRLNRLLRSLILKKRKTKNQESAAQAKSKSKTSTEAMDSAGSEASIAQSAAPTPSAATAAPAALTKPNPSAAPEPEPIPDPIHPEETIS